MHSKQRPLYTENNRSVIEPERFMSNGRIRAYGDVWTVADRANRVRSLHRVIGQLLWCSCTGECRKASMYRQSKSEQGSTVQHEFDFDSRRDLCQIHVNWHSSCPNTEPRHTQTSLIAIALLPF